ncbi:DUF2637 domain-containing protein [Streptomyces sp. NPDC046197]|uniref:DUF2637 domain-containing protein n=1 Tax=Streptomyces sp. NPDC046197 TaxID=3154337 RepID=UPI0033DB1C86
MYDEDIDHRPGHSTGYPDRFNEAGTGRHRAPTGVFSTPLVPPDSAWDPAEELAFMLQDAMLEEQRPRIPAGRDEPSATVPAAGTPLENLQEITAELPPLKEAARGHRKVREHKRLSGVRTASHFIAALAALIASGVSFFGGMVAYDPLRIVALSRMQTSVASWWPLLVYGPWLVASLSVLRAALYQRRAVHSWCVVLLFSSIAMLLCVVQAPRTIIDIAAAALPGLASLACFQQFVRQITLTRPPRRTAPRHRLPRTPPPEPSAEEPAPPAADEPAPAQEAHQPSDADAARPRERW